MPTELKQHGDTGNCGACGADGRIENSQDDCGPEFHNWIGVTGGKPVCHSCFEQE